MNKHKKKPTKKELADLLELSKTTDTTWIEPGKPL